MMKNTLRELRFPTLRTVLYSTVLLPLYFGLTLSVWSIFSRLWLPTPEMPMWLWVLAPLLSAVLLYIVPSLVLGVVLLFWLNKGLSLSKMLGISVAYGVFTLIWTVSIVDWNVSILETILVFGIFTGITYLFLQWISVPSDQRTVPPLFVM